MQSKAKPLSRMIVSRRTPSDQMLQQPANQVLVISVGGSIFHCPVLGPGVAVKDEVLTFAWSMVQPARLANSATTSSQ